MGGLSCAYDSSDGTFVTCNCHIMMNKRFIARVRPPFDPSAFAGWAKYGQTSSCVEERFQKVYGGCTFLFGSAREGLDVVLQACGIQRGELIALADYNCSCLLTPIRHNDADVVFLDVHNDFSYDKDQLSQIIREQRIKVLILTHFFGKSCWNDDIRQIAKEAQKRGIFVIEDCAHSLFDHEQPDIGTLGDAAIFSFGNDKPLSIGKAGVVVVHDSGLHEHIGMLYEGLPLRAHVDERLLFAWYVVYSLYAQPDLCFPGLSCEASPVPILQENTFTNFLDALSSGGAISDLKRYPFFRELCRIARSQRRTFWNRAVGRMKRLLGTRRLGEKTLNADVPEKMNVTSRSLLSAYLDSGIIDEVNAKRALTLHSILLALNVQEQVGSRLRFTWISDTPEQALRTIHAANVRGIEAGCFNWKPLLSAVLRRRRTMPQWAIIPERVINFPLHEGIGESEIRDIRDAILEGMR